MKGEYKCNFLKENYSAFIHKIFMAILHLHDNSSARASCLEGDRRRRSDPKLAKGAERIASLEGSDPDEGRGCAQGNIYTEVKTYRLLDMILFNSSGSTSIPDVMILKYQSPFDW